MRETPIPQPDLPPEEASLRACVATVLELAFEDVPGAAPGQDPLSGWTLSRWLGGRGLGLVRVAEPRSFAWAGPWIARIRPPAPAGARFVVMYGVPSGPVWDPAADGEVDSSWIDEGFVIAATDIALALPSPAPPTSERGVVEAVCIAPSAGAAIETPSAVRALAGRGLAGDRHVAGTGTFPSGPPGSALTLIAAEVCESFDPPLAPDEHRRNVVTRGIDLNALVGHEFSIGRVRCRGMRLCEPCAVAQRYAARPILRQLVHRGGLRADILADGEIALGDPVQAVDPRREGAPAAAIPRARPR